ncbi:MAG TPA: hypothetical protein PKL65_00320 [Bacteroidales bacterium]|jgi:hypothetical protein|nr:hypothetical protein [Bacteroidales bacterium]HNR40648.1 hypothetical protein [Bacteroidales bacterium]HQG77257.1 hypothetical protein [Bacteroidales bacterium]
MPTLIPIIVTTLPDCNSDECPVSLFWQGRNYTIREITDRWYQGNANPEYPVADYFRVMTVEGRQFILKHETLKDAWYLIAEQRNGS